MNLEACDKYIDDIDINLIELVGNDIYNNCRTDLAQLLYVMSILNSSDRIEQLAYDSDFSNVSPDIANAMAQYTDIKRPRNQNKGGGYNMSKGFLELERKYQDLKAVELIKNAMANTRQTYEDVCRMLGITNEDMERYRKMIC